MSIRSYIKKISNSRWEIGIITTKLDDILSGCEIEVAWIKNPFKKSWFADPFVLEETDNKLILLVEEFYKPFGRGRIAMLWVDKESLTIQRKDVILELETHLSFPAFYKKNGEIFIYPENGESGQLTLYKFNKMTNRCEPLKILCNRPLEDAVQVDLFGKRFLFATSLPNPNGSLLEIFLWENDRYVMYADYRFDENIARMSGLFFRHKGKIYRPSQECNTQYGHAVTLQEVDMIDNQKFYFKEVRRLYSVHSKYKVGMHTFNVHRDGLIMTDALTFDHMWFRKALILLHLLPRK